MTEAKQDLTVTRPGARAARHRNGKKAALTPRLSKLVAQVSRITQHTFNAAASSVFLLDKADGELVFKFASGQVGHQLKGARLGKQYGIAGWVTHNGEPLLVNDVKRDRRFDEIVDTVTGFKTKSVMCAPLVAGRKVIGVIEVLNKLDGTGFGEGDLETLVSIAYLTSLSIDNARAAKAR